MTFTTGAELLELCSKYKMPISKIMYERERALEFDEDPTSKMKKAYDIMKDAIRRSLTDSEKSMGGLIGGEAARMNEKRRAGGSLCGAIVGKAITYAMGVLEVNASMGLIVAAPTAGSSGVLPGVLAAVEEEFGICEEDMIAALFNAGAVGYLISRNATVAGAEGGCQAEVGSASAMAASAVTELMGGTPAECLDAASTAISNVMGLVCDPIAGLVEAPCQKRNAMGAANALVSAEITLCKIKHLIPFDEVIEAMYRVGKNMPSELRETAMGGIAATPTACSLCKRM